jgi:hypothetical protein
MRQGNKRRKKKGLKFKQKTTPESTKGTMGFLFSLFNQS